MATQPTQQISNFDAKALLAATAMVATGGTTGTNGTTGGTGGTIDLGSQPPPTPGELEALLARIPIADDGNVIRSEYHNSMRAAIIAVAASLGFTTDNQAVTQTFGPNFSPVGIQPQWALNVGIAEKGAGNAANGWMTVQLPNGARLQSMRVLGRRLGAVAVFEVKLVRQRIAPTSGTSVGMQLQTLFDADLMNAGDPFNVIVDVEEPNNVTGSALSAVIEDYRLVDNSRYKYMITAELSTAVNVAQLYAIQLIYQR